MTRKIFLNASVLVLLAARLAFSQTVWQKYEGNPVLVSSGTWETAGVLGPRVLKVGTLYMMWYTALSTNRQISLATSEDGIHWTKSAANPVLGIGKPGEFDSEHVTYGRILLHQDRYWMWYSGYNGQVWQIGLATSPDGIHWTKHSGNPVLTVGKVGEWDEAGVVAPVIIFDGHIFKMWYNGNGSPYIQAGGYAESSDGIIWKKFSNNPVFTPVPNDWESRSIGMNTIIFSGGIYHLWYGAGGETRNGLGYATSTDGINWERNKSNPILLPGASNAWDGTVLGGFSVWRENGVYKMWYSARRGEIWQIGYAVSAPVIPAERLVFLPRVYGLPGDTINVTLYADPISGISGGDVSINFDPKVLAVTKIATTDFTRHFLVAANLDTPGLARISLAGAQGAAGELGGLVTLRMAVSSSLSLPDTVFSRPLNLRLASFYDQNGQPLPTNKRDGIFVLGKPRGDVNGDGQINAADAILALRIAAGLLQPTPEQFAEADVDANGRVESFDASCILRRAVGLSCPPGGKSPIAASLTVSPFSANSGNFVETEIAVGVIDKIISGDMTLRFETAALEITEIRPSAAMSGVAFVSNLNASGQARISFAATNAIPAKAIAIVRLRAKASVNERNLRSIEGVFFDTQGRRWNSLVTGVHAPEESAGPSQFRLEQNYPNPFHRGYAAASGVSQDLARTQIHYALPQSARVKLVVYDLYGRQVRVLEDAEKAAGEYAQTWDGRDENKKPVASGVYVYRLQAGKQVLNRKLLLF
jgi:predicted GH43/DUF377 family glycosyl hydrolase